MYTFFTLYNQKLQKDYESGINKGNYGGCLIFLVFMLMSLIAFSVIMTTAENDSIGTGTYGEINAVYPICFATFINSTFSILDYVWFTLVPYEGEEPEIKQQFLNWFGPSDPNCIINGNTTICPNDIVYGWNLSSIYRQKEEPTFFHIYNINSELDLISIRGTGSWADIVQDVALYSEVVSIQLFSLILPLTSWFPLSFIQDQVYFSGEFAGWVAPHLREGFYEPVYEYIATNLSHKLVRTSNFTNSVVVVGHSLGAGLAHMVSSRFAFNGISNVYSFGLSPPGSLYSAKKFGFLRPHLDKTTLTIKPNRDPVTMVDAHGGNVQALECNADSGLSCHSSQRSFCQLRNDCNNYNFIRNKSYVNCLCDIPLPRSECI